MKCAYRIAAVHLEPWQLEGCAGVAVHWHEESTPLVCTMQRLLRIVQRLGRRNRLLSTTWLRTRPMRRSGLPRGILAPPWGACAVGGATMSVPLSAAAAGNCCCPGSQAAAAASAATRCIACRRPKLPDAGVGAELDCWRDSVAFACACRASGLPSSPAAQLEDKLHSV